jgi:hypothetical protein
MRKYKATREWGRGTMHRSSVPKNRSRRKWPKYVGIVVILGAVFLLGRNLGVKNSAEISLPAEVQLDIGGTSAAEDTVKDVLSGAVLSIPLGDAIVLDQEIEDEASIAQDTTAVAVDDEAIQIALTPVGGTHGSGTASVQFVDGAYQHVVLATLPDPPVGYFYEGWLLRSKPFDFFSTGKMIQHADDLKWYLLYEGSEDQRDYRKVVITLEPDDQDPAPADHVLEGQF